MMRGEKMLLPLLLTTMVFMGTHSQETSLSTTLSKLIRTKHRMTTHMIAIKANVDKVDGLKSLINILTNLKHRVEEFMGSPLHLRESRHVLDALRKTIQQNEHRTTTGDLLFAGFTLSENNNRRTWKLLQIISQHIEKTSTIKLPKVCQAVGRVSYSEALDDLSDTSAANVCKDISSCPKRKTIYYEKRPPKQAAFDPWTAAYKMLPKNWKLMPFKILRTRLLRNKWMLKQLEILHNDLMSKEATRLKIKYREQDVSSCCRTDGGCNVKIALPMMVGILRYQINEMIYQRLCPQNCPGANCNYIHTYKTVLEDLDRVVSYAGSLPSYWTATWSAFYKDVVETGALKSVNPTMSKVENKKLDFEIATKQCNLIKLSKACPNGDLFKLYQLLKKIQQKRKYDVKIKSLRGRLNKFNLRTLLKYRKENYIQKLSALGSIKKLDKNLQTPVPLKLISAFLDRAQWDKDMATYRVKFIKEKLDSYDRQLRVVELRLNQDLNEAMRVIGEAFGTSNSTLENIVNTFALVVANSNPLNKIFSHTEEVMALLDQNHSAGKRIEPVIKTLNSLIRESSKLRTAFGGHPKQIQSLGNVVMKIKNDQSSNLGQDGDNFLEEYRRNYVPTTDHDSLAKNDVLWSRFRDAICDMLNVGNESSVSNTSTSFLCKRLKETLVKFFKLRQYCFVFQFDLVDAVVGVVRGNIGQRFERSLKGKRDFLQVWQLLTGLFLVQYELQTLASFHCDKLEYQNLGKPVSVCSSVKGLFTDNDISTLVHYIHTTVFEETKRDVYIPIRPQSENDTGFIDLQALAKGDTVVFQIPNDLKWLKKYKWVPHGQTAVPFVQNLELFLPHKENVSKWHFKSITVKITSLGGSSVSAVDNDAVYVLPTNIFMTSYEMASIHCGANEMIHPYSLCNNLPKICDSLTRMSTPNALLPTALTRWSVKALIYAGHFKVVQYDAPSPQTDLLLRAKAVFRVPKNAIKRFSFGNKPYDFQFPLQGCCRGNTYRPSLFNRTCHVCPQGTTSFHGGLFCQ